MASDKTQISRNNLYFTRKDMEPVHGKARSKSNEKEQKDLS